MYCYISKSVIKFNKLFKRIKSNIFDKEIKLDQTLLLAF